MFKGISLKLWAMGQLLEQNKELRGKVVCVQINPARGQVRMFKTWRRRYT